MVETEIVDRLAHALDESLKSLVGGVSTVAVSFSGGLDSSIMAFYASKYSSPKLYVVGAENSPDMRSARQASSSLQFPLVEVELTEDNVRESLPEIVRTVESINPVLISYKLPEYFVTRSASEETILLGNGADELFGGYSRYLGMKPKELAGSMATDLESLLRDEIPIDERISRLYGKNFGYPFLTADIVEVAMDSPLHLKVSKEGRKMVLREVAKRIGLPDEISARKKKAAQYGTGTIRLMKRIAKREGLSISHYVEKLVNF